MMLSRSSNRLCLKSIQTIGQRHFFDYLKVANQVDSGISVEQQKNEEAKEAENAASSSFSWDFIKWYEKHCPEQVGQHNETRSKFQRYESFVIGQSAKAASSNIDFESFRNKIADKSFVDELEIQYSVDSTTLQSIKNMSSLEQWKQESVESFQKENEKTGDLILAPLTQEAKDQLDINATQAEETQERVARMLEEVKKDYEQLDAERMVYGYETDAMKYSEHPRFAETLEDVSASRQSFQDHVMFPFLNENNKQEKLLQIQDENRRKLFLERFEHSSRIVNGYDQGLWGGGGGH